MQHETKRRTWRRGLLLAGRTVGLSYLVLLVSVICFRKPWIEPLPGVQTEMTRPFVREGDLGPDSAYRLMLAAIQTPDELLPEEAKRMAASKDPAELFAPEPDPETGWPSVPPTPVRTWNGTWADALGKFKHHPWPAEPPPAEPAEEWVDGEMLRSRAFPPPEAPWTRKQYEDILRLNRIFGPQVALLDQALATPDPQMPTVDSWNVSFDYLTNARQMARWLAVSAHYRAGTGDFAGAFQDFERILGLGNLISRGGCLINHGAGYACDAITADAAWVVASRERVPAPVLRDAARDFLVAADEAEPFVEAIRVDAQIVKNVVHLFYRERRLYHRPDNPGYSPTFRERFNQRTLFWFLPLVGSTPANTARNLDACYQRLVVMAEQPYRSAMQADYGTFIARFRQDKPMALLFRARDPIGLVHAGIMLPNLERDYLKVAHRDAMLRGMALFLAVRAYETEHGQPPETLDALVPGYLPRVPEDPFDGNPFRYLRRNVPGLPPEAWAVYSIGENFTDEGGVACSIGIYALSYGINPDFVWPSVGYPEPEGE